MKLKYLKKCIIVLVLNNASAKNNAYSSEAASELLESFACSCKSNQQKLASRQYI